jgi:hypothetical protein
MDKGQMLDTFAPKRRLFYWCHGEMLTKAPLEQTFLLVTADFHILALLDQEWIREEKPFGSQEGGVQCPPMTLSILPAISEKLS